MPDQGQPFDHSVPLVPDVSVPLAPDVERLFAELREANERLVLATVQMQELVDATEASRATAEASKAAAERARAEAEAANRGKDEFLAMLGHELRNPLSPILTALHLLKLRGVESHEQAVIERQVRHLSRLVDDLLDVSRITRGKVELRRELLEIAQPIIRAVETVNPLLERRRQVLHVDVPAEGLIVLGDMDRLAQIMTNLLTNASKFSGAKSRVSIAATRHETSVTVHVRDEGIGIDRSMLESIFGTFVQKRQGVDRPQGGLGLGLAIARNLARLHGGTLTGFSEGVGRGSDFSLDLPLMAPTAVIAHDHASNAVRHNGYGTRVLVVDDNTDATDMLGALLRSFGYEVATAYGGREALAIAQGFQPEVALLDIGLPVMDGYQLADQLRSLHLRTTPALVALTGYGQEADQLRSARAGFAAHLVKPVEVRALTSALDRASMRRR